MQPMAAAETGEGQFIA